MLCQMLQDLQAETCSLEREVPAECATCGNADASDSLEIICIHAISGEGLDMRKLKIVETKKDPGYL